MNDDVKQHGFIEPDITPEDYVLGGTGNLGLEILQPDGQWDEFLPPDELQKLRGIETMSCVSFGTLNCIETLLKRKYEEDHNYSERYTAILADTSRNGTTPTKGAEAIRKKGVIPDDLLPFREVSSWRDYHSPNPMFSGYLESGSKWLEKYDFKHEWVFTGGTLLEKQNKLKQALESSPLGISVYAWVQNGEFYTKPEGVRDTHWTMMYGYVDGAYWKIYDSYDDTHKKLVWDFNFGYAKRYTIEKKESLALKYVSGSWRDWWFINIIRKLIWG